VIVPFFVKQALLYASGQLITVSNGYHPDFPIKLFSDYQYGVMVTAPKSVMFIEANPHSMTLGTDTSDSLEISPCLRQAFLH
jgi:hypothetical protein